jgi:hypothetical protein
VALECFSSSGTDDIVLTTACGGDPARRARGPVSRRDGGQGERHRDRPLPAAQVGSPAAAARGLQLVSLIDWGLALGNAD